GNASSGSCAEASMLGHCSGSHWLSAPAAAPAPPAPRSRAAEQRDELAAFHSITSSARASSVGGPVRPSVLAVFRLITRLEWLRERDKTQQEGSNGGALKKSTRTIFHEDTFFPHPPPG